MNCPGSILPPPLHSKIFSCSVRRNSTTFQIFLSVRRLIEVLLKRRRAEGLKKRFSFFREKGIFREVFLRAAPVRPAVQRKIKQRILQ